jgi:hypothetical protein
MSIATDSAIARAWRRGQAGWPSRFVLVQFPNTPLIVALAGSATSRLTNGRTSAYAEAVGQVGLAVFAYLELTDGANWLRRLLGAVVLVVLVVTLARSA